MTANRRSVLIQKNHFALKGRLKTASSHRYTHTVFIRKPVSDDLPDMKSSGFAIIRNPHFLSHRHAARPRPPISLRRSPAFRPPLPPARA
ncbi:hypothetical protein [Neisseria sicca]|uniref:hypothetical protein n=1 Tax=Neisseria sicca TaxID=490 RepID=UPI0011BD1007|nr:hypothetical protein [Neisseria sicca]